MDMSTDAEWLDRDLAEGAAHWPQLEADGPVGLSPIGYEADCVEIKPETLCEWVFGADAVVIGEILDVRGFLTPALRGDMEVEECPIVEGGLEIDLAVESSTHGSPPPTVTVRIGSGVIMYWQVIVSPDGINWNGGPRLAPGMIIGMALHEIPELAVWSPGHDLLFVPSDEGLAFQATESADCHPGPPPAMIGISVEDLLELTAECDPAEGAERRAGVARFIEADPFSFYAARCY